MSNCQLLSYGTHYLCWIYIDFWEKIHTFPILTTQVLKTLKKSLSADLNVQSLRTITQDCCELYWTSPGGNTPQNSSCRAIYHPSREVSKLDKPGMQDTGRSKDELISNYIYIYIFIQIWSHLTWMNIILPKCVTEEFIVSQKHKSLLLYRFE